MQNQKIQYLVVFLSVCVLGLSFLFRDSLRGTPVGASSTWPDIRFASAGPAHESLGNLYTYTWDSMSDPLPPDQPAPYPSHAFLRIVGKLDNRHDGLSCDPCDQANVDQIYAAEQQKIQDLLSREINKSGVWVVGNEANYKPKLAPQIHAYQFKKYRDLIKSLDPAAQISHSGLLSIGWPGVSSSVVTPTVIYLGEFFANLNSAERPDFYNLHLYPSGTDPTYYANNVQQVRQFRASLSNYGELAKPVWITEFGMNVEATQDDANLYMNTLVSSFVSENLAQRWFWFIGTYEPSFVQVTALTKDGAPTLTGSYYQQLAQQYAPPPPPPPSEPLTISNVTVASLSATSATITWTTSGSGTSRVSYGTNAQSLNLSTAENPTLSLSHTVALTGLKKNTRYYFKAHSKNSAGVEYSSPASNFRTKAR